eukprot:CCRYP_005169-RA/>CCRYP_005169-RA protein AED:0.38 eAED:0.38 QI:19/1/1/1/0/0/3/104/64
MHRRVANNIWQRRGILTEARHGNSRNSVHRLSLAFRLAPPCCQQWFAEACKFLCIVFHLGAAWG